MRLIDADALIAQMKADAEQMEEPIAKMFTYAAINDVKHAPTIEPEQKWIPFKSRPLTEEEKEDHPEWDFILDGKLPKDGQRILVNVKYRGHEAVQYDEYYDDGGCYLDSGYEIGTEVTAWMPLPKPYGGEPGC